VSTFLQGPVGALTRIDGRTYDYFGGCGYLGLQSQPQVLQAAADAVLRYGLSTANSRGGLGESPLYTEMEETACAFFACEKVLTFASGYLGAAVLIQGEGQANDHFFIDADAHFSLWDAAAASNHAITPFAHCRPEALQVALQHELTAGERAVVLSDGLFPISGEVAPLPDYLEVLRNLPARLIVDDAHGAGVLGEHGRGTLEFWSITDERVSVSATFNKALGGFGGLVYGRRQALEHLERNSRVLAGSSPLPLPAAAAITQALRLLQVSPQLLQQLQANVRQARAGLEELGWQLPVAETPILCLPARGGLNLFRLREELFHRGIAVEFVNSYPSAPAGGAIRLAVFATHTPAQIERLLAAIRDVLRGQ